MLVLHGVGRAADFDFDAAVGLLDDGHVFLHSRVLGVLGVELHGLIAAHKLSFALVQHLNNVSADFTLVHL